MRRRLLAGLLLAAAGLAPRPAAAQATGASSYEELQRFSAVLNHIRGNYADSVTYNGLVRAAIDGMLRSLDPHSWFSSREDYDRLSAVERGELAVTGLVLEMVDGVPTVQAFPAKSPAAKAGVLPSDRLVRVDGEPVAGLPLTALQLKLAGEKGTRVRLGFERGLRLEPDTFTVTVKRYMPEAQPSVRAVRMLDARTGYVRLGEFGPKAADEVRSAVGRLRGQKAQQLVLDLRGNGGGIVTEAVEIAAEFLPARTLVFSTRGRKKAANEEYRTTSGGSFAAMPLIVLVDERSASASEALAGSLQDHDRALVLGRRSFGKALMQTGFLVPSGFVMLTIGHVVTPSGRVVQRRYQGRSIEQYYAFAGDSTAQDTLHPYRTARGRTVYGGGGIAPDVALPSPAVMPAWLAVAADSGWDAAVADSVAHTLAADQAARAAWMTDAPRWRAALAAPFLARVRARLAVPARVDAATEAAIARRLAVRTAFVRWPPDAGDELEVRSDPDVQAALGYFPRIATLLAGPGAPAGAAQ